MPNTVMAVPCRSGGKASSRTPWLEGWSPPPARPWSTRAPISMLRLVAMPHNADAPVNTAMEIKK